MLALREPYRGTVLLRYFDGLDPCEIAARTSVPVETVRTRLKRAAAQLREAMDARHGGSRGAWAVVLVGPGWSTDALRELGRGLAMGTAKKAVIVAVVLLAAGGATWFAAGRVPRDGADTVTAPAPRDESAVASRCDEPSLRAKDVAPVDPTPVLDPATTRRVLVRAASVIRWRPRRLSCLADATATADGTRTWALTSARGSRPM